MTIRVESSVLHATPSAARLAAWLANQPDSAVNRAVSNPASLGVGADMIGFGGGQPASELYPLEALERAFSRALLEDGRGILPYGPTEGLPALREIIARRLGNRGIKISAGTYERNQLPTQYLSLGTSLFDQVNNPFYGVIKGSGCGLDRPTVQRGQLLRPFPQYCGVAEQEAPLGDSYYDALQLTYTHRFSSGFSVLASYTFSKFIDDVAGNNGWANAGPTSIRNYYNLAAEKSVDGSDIPHSLVVSYIYELPIGRGKKVASNISGPVNAVVGGWQVSGISTFKQGFPLSIAANGNSSGSFGGSQRPNIVGNIHVPHQTINRWFNTSAFVNPEAFTFGTAPRYISTLRAPGYQNWDLAIQKYWRFGDLARLQFRGEMYNAFNHTNLYLPASGLGGTLGGAPSSGGSVTSTFEPRIIQFGLKILY